MKQENLILFDWFSFTSPVHSHFSIIELLGLEKLDFQQLNGHRTYAYKLNYGDINICYDSSVNEGVWVEMTGNGCRQFEEYSDKSFIDILRIIVENPKEYHITRLDVAYDCFDKSVLDIKKLKGETEKLNFISKFKDPVIEYGVRSQSCTIYFGSRSSEIYMRCYDKKKERDREDIDYWVRWEIVLKNDNAFEFAVKLIQGGAIGQLFFGVLNNYIRYIVPDKQQTNISRLDTAKWWLKFVNTLDTISVYTPKPSAYNLYKCENYGYRQAGNAIAALIDIKGIHKFVEELQEQKPKRNAKYQSLIDTNGSASDGILEFLKERNAL